MSISATLYISIYLFTFLVTFGIGLFTLTRRQAPGSAAFAFVTFSEAFWAVCYILGFVSETRGDKILWDNAQYLGTMLLPLGALAFSFTYNNYKPHLVRKVIPPLALLTALVLLLVYTNYFQGSPRPDAYVSRENGFTLLHYNYEIQDWGAMFTGYATMLAALATLFEQSTQQPPVLRRHTHIIMAGFLLPVVVSFLTIFNLPFRPEKDLSPYGFILSNVIIAWGLFRHQMLNVIPVAREQVIEHMDDAYIVLDAGGRIIDLNHAAQAVLRSPVDKALGRDSAQILPLFLTQIDAPPDRTYRTEVRADPDTRGPGIDGHTEVDLFYEVIFTPLFDRQGQVSGRAVVLRNITRRKRTEAILRRVYEVQIHRQSEEKFRTVIEQFGEGFLLIDTRGRINEWNQSQAQISGIAREQAVGKLYWEITNSLLVPERRTPERKAEVRRVAEDWLAHPLTVSHLTEVEIMTPAGERKYVQQNVFPIRVGEEHWLGAVNRDITAQKQALLALERSAAHLAILHEIDRAILAAKSPEDVASAALSRLREIIPFMAARMLLVDEQTGAMRPIFRLGSALPDDAVAAFQEFWRISAGFYQKQPFMIPDLAAAFPAGKEVTLDGVSLTSIVAQANQTLGINAMLIVPLFYSDHGIGALNLAFVDAGPLTADNLEIIRGVADQLAIAIQQAELFVETQRRVQELSGLNEISRAFAHMTSPGEAFGALTEQIARLTRSQRCMIALRDDEGIVRAQAPGYGLDDEQIALAHWRMRPEAELMEMLASGYVKMDCPEEMPPHLLPVMMALGVRNVLGVPLMVEGRITGWALVMDKPGGFASDDLHMLTVFASQVTAVIQNTRLYAQLSQSYDATIAGWSLALELRDKETQGHSMRVMSLSLEMAKCFGIQGEDLEHYRRGVLLHDVGKMGVPDRILLKPGPLDDDEWAIMRQHPDYAYRLLENITYLRPALDIPACHHERWDGSGYPRGLKGEEIPLAARLFAVVDVWDALRSERPYRAPWSQDLAIDYIRRNAGTQFDPRVVDVFLQIIARQSVTSPLS